jgi:hypothetical protein
MPPAQMTSGERLRAALRIEETDRLPIYLRIDPYSSAVLDESYRPLLELAARETDILHEWAPSDSMYLSSLGDITQCTTTRAEGEVLITEVEIDTPRGPLTSVSHRYPGTKSNWVVKQYLESDEDLERFFSLPYTPLRPNLEDYFAEERRLGDRGLMMVRFGDPFFHTAGLVPREELLLWCRVDKPRVARLLAEFQRRLLDFVGYLLEGGLRPVFHVSGSEYVTVPLLGPRDFDEVIVAPCRPIFDLIREHGCPIIVHCHGKVNAILERFVTLGANGLHPVEPPPMGDTTAAEFKARIGKHVCMIGNVELSDMWDLSPEEIDSQCRALIRDAAPGGGLIASISAGPYADVLPDHALANYRQFVASCRRYGG